MKYLIMLYNQIHPNYAGAQPRNKIKGAGRKFEFHGDSCLDPKIVNGVLNTDHIFMDAHNYNDDSTEQYAEHQIFRDLDKVLSALTFTEKETAANPLPLATGAWGCGIFGVRKHILLFSRAHNSLCHCHIDHFSHCKQH